MFLGFSNPIALAGSTPTPGQQLRWRVHDGRGQDSQNAVVSEMRGEVEGRWLSRLESNEMATCRGK